MTAAALRVVLVEDRLADAELISRELKRSGFQCEMIRVQDESALTDALGTFGPDIVLSDHSLPKFSARDTLRVVSRVAPGLPVIVVTGSLEEETAAEYIRNGAIDYIVKERLHRLTPAIARAMELTRAGNDQARAEARFRALIENSADAVIVTGPDQIVRYASPATLGIFGVGPAEYVGQRAFQRVHPDDSATAVSLFRDLVRRPGATVHRELRVQHRNGTWRLVDVVGSNRLNDPAIEGMVAHLRDVTEQRRAEDARREADRRYRELTESAPIGICQATVDGKFLVVNNELARLLGYESPAELAQQSMGSIYVNLSDRTELIGRAVQGGDRHEATVTWRRKDGNLIRVQLTVRALFDASGKVECMEAFIRDVTERERLEEQFRQAQKMEAIGRLAGGVAHDFNNILTAILGSCDLVFSVGTQDPMVIEELTEIRRAAERASVLTRQLLAFSRLHVVARQALDLNVVVRELGGMMRRLIGEDIILELALPDTIGAVNADPGEVEQVLMNLVVNARDAMPQGGRLTIETADTIVDEVYAESHPGLTPGPYVRLAVTDTGTGMSDAVRAHIFEPFFTTKEAGKGTGLGLATVYGIVQRSSGHIGVYSEEGHGTTFKIYFPRTGDPIAPRAAGQAMPVANGTERVLVVEDEEAVRKITRRVLQGRGYEVLEAASGEEAIRISESTADPIDLLVTDVVMPRLNGPELATRLLVSRPGLKVLYLSGYADDAVFRHGILDSSAKFLQKPFSADALARTVRSVLDAAGEPRR